jgi:hypothetical protein
MTQWQIAAGINDTGGKFATGINDTGGKFATGVNDTGGKFAAVVNDAGGKLPPVSTPQVSLTPLANKRDHIRLQTPESELEGKNLYICFLYYQKLTKQNY